MALINCPECNCEISDTVKTCPKCGYKIAKSKISKQWKIAGILIALVVAVGIAVFAFGGNRLGKEQTAVLNGAKLLQSELLVPDSIELYAAYVSERFSESGTSVFLHFSSENEGGGTTEAYTVIIDGKVCFDTTTDDIEGMIDAGAHEKASNAIDDSLRVTLVASQIEMGAEQWVPVDVEDVVSRLK